MGIRNLNRYLRDNCPESIRCINIADLSGKKIVVDISIYLYKYEAENALLENMYVMLSIFRYYNIIPIFIFDGKPPPEKKALLQKRREDRQAAQEEYDLLKEKLESKEDDDDKQDIVAAMDQLKKQIVQLNKEKIETVKNLIRSYGATYYDAPGEADELCALLVIKKKVWACLSEDMDMIINGCPTLIKSLDGKYYVYIYDKIIKTLNISSEELCKFASLLGSDYSRSANSKIDSSALLDICKKHNFNLQNILNEIIICDVHRKHFIEQSNNSFGLSELTDLLFDHNQDYELLNNINKYYCTAYKLLNFYNNDKNIHIELFNNSYKNKPCNSIIT